MYFPTIIDPKDFKVQTASAGNQPPFYFGASNVPLTLGKSRPSRSQIRLRKLVKRR
jgi:hypothetical protein